MYTGTMAGLGFGMPGAIGAKVAQPHRPVVAMIGDGAFSLSLPALITAVEYQIPVQILVFDNACWGAEKSHQQQWFDSHYVGSDLKTADLVGIARSIGADALRVKDLDELTSAMRSEPTTNPRVVVIPTDPNRFPKVVPNIGAPAKSFKS
jgi:acetolactate synthase-1/2/3 large subunit